MPVSVYLRGDRTWPNERLMVSITTSRELRGPERAVVRIPTVHQAVHAPRRSF